MGVRRSVRPLFVIRLTLRLRQRGLGCYLSEEQIKQENSTPHREND